MSKIKKLYVRIVLFFLTPVICAAIEAREARQRRELSERMKTAAPSSSFLVSENGMLELCWATGEIKLRAAEIDPG